MLMCVCLRILASPRIPQYDLGRQTPHFRGGSVTLGGLKLVLYSESVSLYQMIAAQFQITKIEPLSSTN
jgi:hypothetical protein